MTAKLKQHEPKKTFSRDIRRFPFPHRSCIASERRQASSQAGAYKLTYDLPAIYRTDNHFTYLTDDNLHQFLSGDLNVERLDHMYPFLVLAGRRMAARPLHRQLMMGRPVVVVEQADLHLTWNDSGVLIKPFPPYLFDSQTWSQHMCIDSELYKQACGFIRSYTWLISGENDFNIAMNLDHGMTLLPRGVTWPIWVQFVRDFVRETNTVGLDCFHRRYNHGELRLRNLNWIYRIWPPRWQLKYILRGYYFGFHTYQSYFRRNFAWLIAVFAYVSVMLAAMQLGISTNRLQSSATFQSLSYGVAAAATIIPVILAAYVLVLLMLLVGSNLFSTFQNINEHRREAGARDRIKEDFT
ncbi:MAG: hypothetical protein Q9160_006308 [Pyrenula sp. 1 TL-2023]